MRRQGFEYLHVGGREGFRHRRGGGFLRNDGRCRGIVSSVTGGERRGVVGNGSGAALVYLVDGLQYGNGATGTVQYGNHHHVADSLGLIGHDGGYFGTEIWFRVYIGNVPRFGREGGTGNDTTAEGNEDPFRWKGRDGLVGSGSGAGQRGVVLAPTSVLGVEKGAVWSRCGDGGGGEDVRGVSPVVGGMVDRGWWIHEEKEDGGLGSDETSRLRNNVLKNAVHDGLSFADLYFLRVNKEQREHPDNATNDNTDGTAKLIGEAHRTQLPLGRGEWWCVQTQLIGTKIFNDGPEHNASHVTDNVANRGGTHGRYPQEYT